MFGYTNLILFGNEQKDFFNIAYLSSDANTSLSHLDGSLHGVWWQLNAR